MVIQRHSIIFMSLATGTTIVDGSFGKARSFNGTSDYIDVGTGLGIGWTSSFTIEAWAKVSTSGGEEYILGNHWRAGTAIGLGLARDSTKPYFLSGANPSSCSSCPISEETSSGGSWETSRMDRQRIRSCSIRQTSTLVSIFIASRCGEITVK